MTVSLDKLRSVCKSKAFRIALILLAAVLLVFLCLNVFGKQGAEKGYSTEQETRIAALLERLDGVKDASVLITEAEGEAVGAVVLFKGEDGLILRMNILEITANALHIPKSAVTVYPAKS